MAEAPPPKPHKETRIAVLISGSGTNLQAIIDALPPVTTTTITSSSPAAAAASVPSHDPNRPPPVIPNARIVRVVSNRKAAFGLERAKRAGIETAYHNLVPYKKEATATAAALAAKGEGTEDAEAIERIAREKYDAKLAELVLKDEPHLVVCAGWMHILSPKFLQPLNDAQVEIINLHPALPGEYNGANAIARAHADFLAGRTTRTGVMIHRVIPEVDMGEPILVREIQFDAARGDAELSAFEEKVHEVEWEAIVEGTRRAAEGYWEKWGGGDGLGGEERGGAER